MALSRQRIHYGGNTDFPWEAAAIKAIIEILPDTDPHQVWPLQELHESHSGRLYELDMVVLTRVGLFVIEIKSHPGALKGSLRHWVVEEKSGRRRSLDNPPLPQPPQGPNSGDGFGAPAQQSLDSPPMGRVAGLHARGPSRRPPRWLPCLSLHAPRRAAPASHPRRPRQPPRTLVNRPMMRAVLEGLRQLGMEPSQRRYRVGDFKLNQLLAEGPGYQEHLALGALDEEVRVRSYTVPQASSRERRAQLERAAEREGRVLVRLGRHPNILSFKTYVSEGGLGASSGLRALRRR